MLLTLNKSKKVGYFVNKTVRPTLVTYPLLSSIVNEDIRVILNFFVFCFFLQEDFTRTKSTKRHTSKQKQKNSIFMHIKTSKRKKTLV